MSANELTAEQVRKAIFNGSSYASYDGVKYYADGINMQAIADELNSRAERTCKVEGDYWHDHGGDGSDTYEYVLSCDHSVEWLDDEEEPRYCPRCGARIEVGE